MAANSLPFRFSPDYSDTTAHFIGFRMWDGLTTPELVTLTGLRYLRVSDALRNIQDSTALGISMKTAVFDYSQAGFLRFYNAAATEVFRLHLNSNLLIEAKRGSTILATGATQFPGTSTPGTVDVSLGFHDTAGDVLVRINGVQQFALTNVDTLNAAGPVTSFRAGERPDFTNNWFYLRDLIVQQRSGGAGTGLLGPRKLVFLAPTSDATPNEWTDHAGGSPNKFAAVDEAKADGDTTALKTSTDGLIEMYGYQDLADVGAVGTPAAVGMYLTGYLPTSGAAKYLARLLSGAASAESEALTPGDSAYRGQQFWWELDPDGNVAWTTAKVNALVAGMKSVAG